MGPEVHRAFAALERRQPELDPKLNEASFPPPLARGKLTNELIRWFYPAVVREKVLYELHPDLYLRPRANLDIELPLPDHPHGRIRARTNSLGMRNEREPGAGSPDLRVLVTGALNAYGVVDGHESTAGVMERRLKNASPEASVEVLNAACGSYNFYNFVAMLEAARPLAPDVFVVLAYTGDDFFGGVKQWRFFRGLGPAKEGRYDGRRLLESDSPFERNLLGLEIGQVAYALNNPEDFNLALCVACSAVVEMQRIAESTGTTLVFACLPPPLTGQPDRMRKSREKVEALLDFPPDAIDLSDRIGDRWIEFLRGRELEVCDLRDQFRGHDEPLYFEDDGHANVAAHALMGERLAAVVDRVHKSSSGQSGPKGRFVHVSSQIRDAVRSSFQSILLRDPTGAEMIDAHARLKKAFPTPEAQTAAVASGMVTRYLGLRPLKLEMDLANQCNIRCVMCHFSGSEYSYANLPKQEMSIEQFTSIADQIFPYCSDLSLSISTEPLLNSSFVEILEVVARYEVPFVYMHTNALLLTEESSAAVVRSGLHQISVSIDGATAGTYEAIRKGGNFARLMENLETLVELRESLGSETPHLAFNVVLMRSNIEELPELVRLAKRLGGVAVAAVHVVPLAIAKAGEEESLSQDKELYNRIRTEALAVAEEVGVNVVLPEPFDLALHAVEPAGKASDGPGSSAAIPSAAEPAMAKPSAPLSASNPNLPMAEVWGVKSEKPACHFPFHFVGLDSRGNLMPCGWWYNQPVLGNVLDTPFLSIWNGEEYTKLRRELMDRTPREVCRNCPAAGMGSVDEPTSFQER